MLSSFLTNISIEVGEIFFFLLCIFSCGVESGLVNALHHVGIQKKEMEEGKGGGYFLLTEKPTVVVFSLPPREKKARFSS